MNRITRPQAEALATFVARIRDDWDHPGIVAAIGNARELGTAADVAVALCRLAGNRELRTPATLHQPGSHWRDTAVAARLAPVNCPDHPAHLTRDCPECAALSDRADHAKGAAAARAAIKPPPKPNRPPEPPPRDLDAVRARADQEAT